MTPNNSRSKNALLNIVFSLLMQFITVISGLILPRIFIPTYGSAVNGLISSITQFLSYISLLETGVGGVITAALYKPVSQSDMLGVSGIINAAKQFYRKIAFTFIFYTVLLCVGYPYLIKTEFDFFYVISLILILSVGTFFQYFFSLPYINLLTTDQKARITYIVQSTTILANLVVSFICIKCGATIHVLKLVSCLVFLFKPIFYCLYIKKHYSLDKKCAPNTAVIKQRWNGLAHNLAFFIHNNTDIVIITMFLDIKYASVYTVYLAVISGIQRIITSVSQGSAAGIGNLIAIGDKQALNRVMDTFEFVQFSLTTILYTITFIMIIPFMRIYTSGITDINYIQPFFAGFLILSEAVYCIRCVYSTVSLSAGRYKETQLGAIIEALINICVSLALVHKFGIAGVAFGTMIGMLARLIFDVIYLSKHIIHRSIVKHLKILIVSAVASATSIFVCSFLTPIIQYTFLSWIFRACIVAAITIALSMLYYTLFYKDRIKDLLRTLKKAFVKK